MNRLRNLFFKIRRSKGSFQIHKWEEEEELVSIHIRRCLYTWLSVVITYQIFRETFFHEVTAFYEPVMLIGFIILYHLMRLKGGLYLRVTRISYLCFPLLLFIISQSRTQFRILCHEWEVAMADQGIEFLKIGKIGTLGVYGDILIIGFMLWILMAFYEMGKKQEWLMLIIPVLCSACFYLMLGWKPSWWFFPLLATDTLMFIMPSMAAWGVLSLLVVLLAFIAHFQLYKTEYRDTKAYETWQRTRYGMESVAFAEGDMTKAVGLERGNEVALEIKSEAKKPYYLKGFVGTVYNGKNQWTNDRASIRKLEKGVLGDAGDIMEYLHENDYYGYDILINHKKVSTLSTYYLSIHNVGASRKYLYLPYENKIKTEDFIYEDLALNAASEVLLAKGISGQSDYRILASQSLAGITATVMDEAEIRSNLQVKNGHRSSGYGLKKSAQSIYMDYIYRVCLALPKSSKEAVAKEMKGLHSGNVSPQGAYSTILSWIQKNIKYTDQPQKIPEGESFLPWFLTKSKEGNDVYIASLGTVMFRAFGIPARYVEGYLYRPEKNNIKTDVLQSDAHAWVEIYVDNLGWIPVELSQPYMDFAPSYLPNYQAVIEGDVSMEDEEEEKQEEEDSTEELKENESETTESDSAKAEDESKSEKRKQRNWKKLLINLLEILGKLMAGILGLFMTVCFIWLIVRVCIHFIQEYRWKRSIQAAVCITEWYRHLMMELYLLENVKNSKFDDWDNRNEKIIALILCYDEDCDKSELAYCMRIYQRTLFGSRMISWRDRKRYVKFMQSERKILRKQLNFRQKLRLILAREFN